VYILNYLYYILLSLGNVWVECQEPNWIKRGNVYGSVMYVSGRTFKYKIYAEDWGQGWEISKCESKYHDHVLRKKAGLIK